MDFPFRTAVIVSVIAVAGCGGGSDNVVQPAVPAAVSSTPSSSTGTISSTSTTEISGKVSYDHVPHTILSGLDYSNTSSMPVRGAVIEVVDAAGAVLANTISDENGRYTLDAPANINARILVKAQLISETGATWDFSVTDNTQDNQIYALQGSLASTGQNSQQTRNLHAPHGWTGQSYGDVRAAAPFAILDTVYKTAQTFADIDANIQFPALELRWSTENKTQFGQRSLGQIGTSSYVPDDDGGGAIYILGQEGRDTDEFDAHVIIHEWGHYFEHQVSRTDSFGGAHSLNDRLDARVAFSEGWSNALSGIITGDPIYRDSSGSDQASGFSFDLENHQAINPGWFSEASIGAVIYDIFDADRDVGDNISQGLTPLYEVMKSESYKEAPVFATIFALADGLRQNNPEDADGINSLLANHFISGQGPNGNGESNSGAIRSALPVYKEATLNGPSARLCSVDDAGWHNKLGNREFIFLKLEEQQDVTLSLVKVTGDEARDPDFNIWRGTTLVHNAASSAAGQEVFQGVLTAGEYVVEAFDFYNVNGTGTNRGDGCYDFTAAG